MLDLCVHQGAGLQGIALQTAPRVVAMASHGNQQGELPLLWSLCSTLVGFGYPVAVLDATTIESSGNPGLVQVLEDACWRADESSSEPVAWTVIPAALGLQRLCDQAAQRALPLEPLSDLFRGFGVIVIYAGAGVLARLLPDSSIEPLLAVSPVKMSGVTAYRALKQMLLTAKLRPTAAAIISESDLNTSVAPHSPVKNLQKCAMTFLDYRLDSLPVRPQAIPESPSDDIQRLALRLLENAMLLHRNHFVGSH